MTSPLLSQVARQIHQGMSSIFLPATLTRATAGAGDPFDPGTPTTTSYSCRAIHEDWSAYHMASNLVAGSDRKIIILANSLGFAPEAGDQVSIRGETFTIYGSGAGQPAVEADPALATYTCRARK